MARLLEEVDVEEDRRFHLAVAAAGVLAAPELREGVPDRETGRLPEGAPRGKLGEHEEVQLAPELAVVARAGLLEALLVGAQLLLGEEGRPVDPCEHLARGVPPPVGPRDRLQLDRLDRRRRGGVGPAAEVREGTVRVEGDRLQRLIRSGRADEVVDQLDLVVLALREEALARLRRSDVLAREGLRRLDVLTHALFDPREVPLGDRRPLGKVEVVVEALRDRRADRDLHALI